MVPLQRRFVMGPVRLVLRSARKWTSFLVAVMAAGSFYGIVWKLPASSVPPWPLLGERERQAIILESRKTNAQILGGVALLVGLYFTWRNVRIMEEGKNTERFTRAVDQLGSEKIAQRVGGIYALERLAEDSGRDRAAILELMCAFLRHRDRMPEEAEDKLPIGAPPHMVEMVESNRVMNKAMGWVPPAPEDVKAAVAVIRRNRFNFSSQHVLDLSSADLRRVRLEGAKLAGANLYGIFGGNSELKTADLRKSYLAFADLKLANLDRTDLRGATIGGARFDFASLRNADLRGAMLVRRPEYEVERDPEIDRLIERRPSVHFVHADLRDALVEGLELRRADVRDADLSTAVGLTYGQLEHAIGNNGTKLPPGIQRPPTWNLGSE
jgi:hypothetical protein